VQGVCVPGCFNGLPCGIHCCIDNEVCVDDLCVIPCADGRAHCGGRCCALTETCFADVCAEDQGAGSYLLEAEWDGSGTAGGKFGGPSALALDAEGNVYVIDPDKGRIQKFDDNGDYLDHWDATGYGLTVAENAYVFVANSSLVSKYETDGEFVEYWSGGGGGPSLNGAQDIAADAAGNIYVINSIGNTVVTFDREGDAIDSWAGNNGAFSFADGIAVDASNGWVYVADTSNHRVQKFDTDGNFIAELGAAHTPSSAEGKFNSPNGLAVDGEGNLFVADFGNDRIQIFDSDGEFLTTFSADIEGDGELDGPTGVAVDEHGNVFVTDYLNKRVLKFVIPGEASPQRQQLRAESAEPRQPGRNRTRSRRGRRRHR
jgi:DNA-binding beta-propeller fold protein YncE